MKKRIILALLALVVMTMQAHVDVEVSETVELMSILSRTAGWDPYHMDMGGQYTEDVEAWFSPYENHPIIGYYNEFMQNYAQGFNDPMYLATAFGIEGQRVKLLCPKDCLEPHWQAADMDEFIDKLNQFYTDTRFHEFYQQHLPFYQQVMNEYKNNVMKYFNQDWYAPFYGTNPEESFRVIIGFTNGAQNYGFAHQFPGQPKENISVCSYWVTPNGGFEYDAENGRQASPTLVHEFNHSFVNPLQEIEKNAVLLGDIPQRLLEKEFFHMTQVQRYGQGSIVFNESVVRAAVIIYMMENGYSPEEVQAELESNISYGFTWLPELVTAMRYYNKHRSKYPTLNDFYPEIAKVLNKYLDADDKKMEKTLKFNQTANKPNTEANSLKAEVMETVELMSILSRIAGYREYNMMKSNQYINDVDAWFEPFSQHPIIEYYQNLWRQYHISYDAPMSLAVRLSIEEGKIVKLHEDTSDNNAGLDGRWNNVDMKQFLDLLNQFYTDTRFHDFFQQHQQFYQERLNAFNEKVMPYVHPEWYENFYGKQSNDQQRVVIGFATRDNGYYGATRHLEGQTWERFVILCYLDLSHIKEIQQEKRDMVASGITTMLCSPIGRTSALEEQNTATLNDIGNKLLDKNPLLGNVYGFRDGRALIKKTIDEAVELAYVMENGGTAEQVGQQLADDISTGLTWMPELFTAIRDYHAHRNKYPTLNDFYPQIAKVLNKYLETEQKRIDKALK